jgi:hypothetical protein
MKQNASLKHFRINAKEIALCENLCMWETDQSLKSSFLIKEIQWSCYQWQYTNYLAIHWGLALRSPSDTKTHRCSSPLSLFCIEPTQSSCRFKIISQVDCLGLMPKILATWLRSGGLWFKASQGKKFLKLPPPPLPTYHLHNIQSKVDWWYGPRGKTPLLQAQSPEFKPQSHQNQPINHLSLSCNTWYNENAMQILDTECLLGSNGQGKVCTGSGQFFWIWLNLQMGKLQIYG